MSWIGDTWSVVFLRLPLFLSILILALYSAALWPLLFREASVKNLPCRDRWSVLVSVFGIMPVWMLLFVILLFSLLVACRPLLSRFSVEVCWLKVCQISFCALVFVWPIAAWVSFRIALRRLDWKQRPPMMLFMCKRVSAALAIAISCVWVFFHFFIAGGHSFDHVAEFGPRNFGAFVEWAKEEPLDFGDGYRVRFPFRTDCPLCRLESVFGRECAEKWRAKNAEAEPNDHH